MRRFQGLKRPLRVRTDARRLKRGGLALTRRTTTRHAGRYAAIRGARRIQRQRCSSQSTGHAPVGTPTAAQSALASCIGVCGADAGVVRRFGRAGGCRYLGPGGQYVRSHPDRGFRRRDRGRAALGDMAHSRTWPHLRGERIAARQGRRAQRVVAARRGDAEPARPAGRRLGQRPQEAGVDRLAAHGSRRP